MEPAFAEPDRNRAHLAALISDAAANGARLIVAPELCISGYAFRTREQAHALSEPVDGPTVGNWRELADKHDAYIVGGICERDGERLFNSAVMVGPRGYTALYRKLHLWRDETLFFEPGDTGIPVFDTPFARVGILICYDQWFPETYRSLALDGADIVCVPTAWMPIPGQEPGRDAMANIVAMAAAHSNALFVACAARIGREDAVEFAGKSLIVGCTGWPVGGPASANREEIVWATVNVADAHRRRRWSKFNDIVLDRRPDIYRLS